MQNFTERRVRELPELGAKLHEWEHDGTGAQIVWLERPDENKTFGIAFATQPENSTGVFHILEHSVLNGSDRYPVKEPFVELLKTSMNTFLNAMTFPDKTVYPISSRNDKDFLNLMRVYLDAVLHPRIYSMPEIFYQEGWHYEFDEEGKPSYKGVVFNEMKGAYASPDDQLEETVKSLLFPDTCYGYSSGGDPANIPDLTYEQFIDTHRRFYSPSNAYIFLDGDMNIEEVLHIIDAEYLAGYERTDRLTPPAMQAPVKTERLTKYYEIGADEDLEGKARLAMSGVCGRFDEREKMTALQAISQVLCGNNMAPLTRRMLEEGLAEDVSLSVTDGVLQPWVQLEVKNLKEENIELVREAIIDELTKQANGAFDHESLESVLANQEFTMRERDFGTMPQGLVFSFAMLESWLYGGDPAAGLEVGDLFDRLRAKMDTGYFEDLIRTCLLENPHACEVVMLPSKEEGEVRRQKEQDRLKAEDAAWTAEEKQTLIDRADKLLAWQNEEDTEEALATLPVLTLEDIDAELKDLPLTEVEIGGFKVLKHAVAAAGIVYTKLYFDLTDLPVEEVSKATLLSEVLGELPTKHSTVEELIIRRQRLCGSLTFQPGAYGVEPSKPFARKFTVTYSALEHNLEAATELVYEILTETRFDDESAVRDILRQNIMMASQTMIMSGHALAVSRVATMFMPSAVFDDHMGGYAFLSWLKAQDEKESIEPLCAELAEMASRLFVKNRLVISQIGTMEQAANIVTGLFDSLAIGEIGEPAVYTPRGACREGIAIPADIAFAGMGGNLYAKAPFHGSYPLAARILTFGWLWNSIRVQGGAYGTGCGWRKSGTVTFYSYRDPNAARSLEQYKLSADFLRQMAEEELTGFIIGVISDQSPLLTPRLMGVHADSYYWSGSTIEERRKTRQELLSATADDIHRAADLLDSLDEECGVCVVGERGQIEACGIETIYAI